MAAKSALNLCDCFFFLLVETLSEFDCDCFSLCFCRNVNTYISEVEGFTQTGKS